MLATVVDKLSEIFLHFCGKLHVGVIFHVKRLLCLLLKVETKFKCCPLHTFGWIQYFVRPDLGPNCLQALSKQL